MPAAAQTLAVIDFETTGISPAPGRARHRDRRGAGQRRAHRRSLCQPDEQRGLGRPFIEQLTGISNRMLDAAAAGRSGDARGDAPSPAGCRWWRTTPPSTAASGLPRRSAPASRRRRAPLSPARCCCRGGCTRRLPNHRLGTLAAMLRAAALRARPPRAGRRRDDGASAAEDPARCERTLPSSARFQGRGPRPAAGAAERRRHADAALRGTPRTDARTGRRLIAALAYLSRPAHELRWIKRVGHGSCPK